MIATVFVEQDCTIEHEGRKFTAGGAVVTPDHVTAYLGKSESGSHSSGPLTDWHGNTLGTWTITRRWHVWGRFGRTDMAQVYAWIGDTCYQGRSQGIGMVFNGRKCKATR